MEVELRKLELLLLIILNNLIKKQTTPPDMEEEKGAEREYSIIIMSFLRQSEREIHIRAINFAHYLLRDTIWKQV